MFKRPLQSTVISSLFLMGVSQLAMAEVDLNGLWFPGGGPGQNPRELPFNDFAKKLSDDYVANFKIDDDPGGWCVSPGLPRSIWGAPFPVEIHQTEEFITMFWEGYFQYRKIYLEGHPRPDAILHTGMGYSVGHWEGDTLVVETTHLREYPYMRRLPNTEEATTTERITVENRVNDKGVSTRYLNNVLTLTDDNLYTQPVTVTSSLRWSPDTPIMEYSCSEEIYEKHLQERGIQPADFYQGQ
ncbi:MAG: hypothetical protein V4603_02845 [Pseudomonadota bacterium]